jgi:hypothetical protein
MATGLNNLAGLLHELGDLAGACAALERALAIYEQQLSPNYPTAQRIRANLAALGTSATWVQDKS